MTMQQTLHILMAQTNSDVGNLKKNAEKIIQIIESNQGSHDLIVFPELALTGYPPEDLLFRKELHKEVAHYLETIVKATEDCYVLMGHPTVISNDSFYNSVSIIHQGQVIRVYHKQKLPNYEIFDEARYFVAGPKDPCIFTIKGQRIGFCICEDLWQPGPVEELLDNNISIFVSANASPFDHGKYYRREKILKDYAQQGISVVYINQTCGQDELLFDGQSMALDKTGKICARAKAFEEELCSVTIKGDEVRGSVAPLLSKEALIYKGLVYGIREYVTKNHFQGALLGLSGGVDSALTLCLAVDALGARNVHAVMMPSRHSLPMSSEDAMKQIEALKVSYSNLSIEPAFQALLETLKPYLNEAAPGITEENLQARIRGQLLMALSNQTGKIVLTTSNKSEAAVGYATLYGDMAGGLAVLKDVLKTQVYALARYRNSIGQVIPERVLTRAPSAELRPNQTDQDSLPDYEVIDGILEPFIEDNASVDELVARGFKREEVQKVIRLLQLSEYKRHQSPPGIKISPIAFGKDWRYPLTHGFQLFK